MNCFWKRKKNEKAFDPPSLKQPNKLYLAFFYEFCTSYIVGTDGALDAKFSQTCREFKYTVLKYSFLTSFLSVISDACFYFDEELVRRPICNPGSFCSI